MTAKPASPMRDRACEASMVVVSRERERGNWDCGLVRWVDLCDICMWCGHASGGLVEGAKRQRLNHQREGARGWASMPSRIMFEFCVPTSSSF
jgi:hypothetical protein